jgi:hypothetical protein
MPAADVLPARLVTALVCVAVCVVFARWHTRRGNRAVWALIGLVSAGAGVAAAWTYTTAARACIASYEGRRLIVGRELTPLAAEYVRRNPGQSREDLLLDAGGRTDVVWAARSLRDCYLIITWCGLAALPLLTSALLSGVRATGGRYLPGRATPAAPEVSVHTYDAFISYRHAEPDRGIAFDLLERLEKAGFRMCIDLRDFRPQESFVAEMERCIRASRFVLCVITSQYLASDHTLEEAVISKVIDLEERERRLVPLVFEPVIMPVWLHGIVGIDCSGDSPVDPFERLVQMLSA